MNIFLLMIIDFLFILFLLILHFLNYKIVIKSYNLIQNVLFLFL
jgi:hypothetical protein